MKINGKRMTNYSGGDYWSGVIASVAAVGLHIWLFKYVGNYGIFAGVALVMWVGWIRKEWWGR